MEDLWPDLEPFDFKPPVTIIRNQASLLGSKTDNIIQARVRAMEEDDHDFSFGFYIIAPSLGNYEVNLFDIHHGVLLYPVKFWVEEEILTELGLDEGPMANNEEEFLNYIKAIFNTPKTRKILRALLTQSTGK